MIVCGSVSSPGSSWPKVTRSSSRRVHNTARQTARRNGSTWRRQEPARPGDCSIISWARSDPAKKTMTKTGKTQDFIGGTPFSQESFRQLRAEWGWARPSGRMLQGMPGRTLGACIYLKDAHAEPTGKRHVIVFSQEANSVNGLKLLGSLGLQTRLAPSRKDGVVGAL